MMLNQIRVSLPERVVIFKHGLPVRVLGPGKHTIWGSGVTEYRYDTDALVFDAPAEVRALLPIDWYDEAHLDPRQRGVLYRDDVPVRFLRPGVHRFWTVDSVKLVVHSVDQPVPDLTDELIDLIPDDELVVVTVRQPERGLLYVQGRFERLLEPGRHAFWSHPEAKVVVQVLDMRMQQVTIPGQELMTRDKVTLRLTLTVEYAPADPPVVVHSVADVHDAIYLLVQLAARDYLAGVTLDELLEGRDAMTRYLETAVVAKAQLFGVAIHRVGVKDVVLPGEMKALLNRVIEADKQAAANVILRRDEAAVTRSMANTARVIADNPVLFELKKLEALKEIADRIDEVKLVVGGDSLKTLLGSKLLESKDD